MIGPAGHQLDIASAQGPHHARHVLPTTVCVPKPPVVATAPGPDVAVVRKHYGVPCVEVVDGWMRGELDN